MPLKGPYHPPPFQGLVSRLQMPRETKKDTGGGVRRSYHRDLSKSIPSIGRRFPFKPFSIGY